MSVEITDVRCVRLEGTMDESPEGFYADRQARPLDVYDEFRGIEPSETYLQADPEETYHPYEADGDLKIGGYFLRVETDAGVTGLSGPLGRTWASLAMDVADLLVGRDPRATEKLWDLLYRQEVHGRKGRTMQAISALDVACWDAKGKYYGEPVHRLLGGPTREELPAYVSTLEFSVEPDDVRGRAADFAERGYDAQKWFFRHGPGSGTEGIEKNVALVEAAREAVGEEYDLMFDAWMSWDLPYARDMLPRLAPYEPRWVEEPLRPDLIDQTAKLRAEAPFPIAGGEHEYTRWGIHDLLERDAFDVLQPDTYWAGGITELEKVFALASVYDVPVIPHGHSVPANAQLAAAQPPTLAPRVEYLHKFNLGRQFFFDEPVIPEDGTVAVPDRPGIGVEIDGAKVEDEREVEF